MKKTVALLLLAALGLGMLIQHVRRKRPDA